GHTSPVESVGFLLDESHILSRDRDGLFQQWLLGPKKTFSRRYSVVKEPSTGDDNSHPHTPVIGTSDFVINPDGWITHGRRHIFWIPFSNRPFSQYGDLLLVASHEHILCFGSPSGTFTILDLSEIIGA
ncbi:hypothetical protein BS47DRAFT_1483370, partial [Hydnum rufescens UP504]